MVKKVLKVATDETQETCGSMIAKTLRSDILRPNSGGCSFVSIKFNKVNYENN